MPDLTNSEDDERKKLSELSKLLGQSSEKFAKIAHSKNDFLANYLIGLLKEEDMRLLQDSKYLKPIMDAIVALKWQSLYQIHYEISYAKLHDTNPQTQQEFDAVLQELMLLPKIGDGSN
ncbi:MAG: hypothetical protein U0X91_32170 [Spirosomataceae bacterium]